MTESEFPSDLDMSEWTPEDRLEFYRQYFFERPLGGRDLR